MAKVSQIITVVLGTLGTFLMLSAALNINSGSIKGLGTLFFMLIHFIVSIIALPFLLYATYKLEEIPHWFRNWVVTLIILNALFMLVSSGAVEGGKGMFGLYALLELIPLLFFRHNRYKLAPKNVFRDG